MLNRNFVYIHLFFFVFIFSCASAPKVYESDSLQKQSNESGQNDPNLSAQVANDIAQLKNANDYILQSGDLVDIKIFMENGMDRTLRIGGSGTVNLPLAGNVKIAALSIIQAEEVIANELKKYLINPQVSLFVKEYGNTTIYILGEVKTPSAIQIPPGKSLTVLEAITSAGGFTPVAAVSKVKVLRMENGTQKSIEVDISQITKQGKKSLDINLMPNDVIFVPQSMF